MILHGLLLIDPDDRPELGWIRVDGERIAALGHGDPPSPPDRGGPEAIICPGFVDAHTHVPQVHAIGCDVPDLLRWLETVIYPAEAAWSAPAVAEAHARCGLRRMLRAGTLTFAGFLTSHAHGLDAIRRVHDALPLRAIVGTALMDRNAPGPLLEATFTPPPPPAGRLAFSVNPRFAVCCTEPMLEAAGRCAAAGAVVQTHLAEQRRECDLVRDLFPADASYTAVYDRFGLLTGRTLLAHCLHLAPEEWELIAKRRSVVVHCPAANTFLESGLFDLDAARRHGVRLALGTDVAAGPDVAMPRAARAMIEVAKLRRLTIAPSAHVPTPSEAWRQITSGNADALGMPDAGRLAVGAAADVLVLRAPVPADEHLIGRLLYTWRDAYITDRVVGGRVIAAGGDSASDAPLDH